MAALENLIGDKAAEARPMYLEQLRLARYGNDAERTEGARWIQGYIGHMILPALFAEGYINAMWAVYNYYRDSYTGDLAELEKYATIDDREGNLTMAKISIQRLKEIKSHSGSSSSTSTGSSHSGSSSSHSGSSSSTSTGSSHSGSSSSHSGSSSSTSTGSSHSGSSSSTSTGSSHSGSSGSTYGTNPYLPTLYTKLDPNAGQWDFKFNNGETISTADYDQALLIEATIYKIGKGPRPGAQSWTTADGTYYNYADAWEAFTQRFSQEMGYTNEAGNELLNEQYNEEAFNVANQNSTPSDITINTNKDAKKSNLMWWLLGGSVVVLGIGLFISRKNKKNKR